MGCWAWSRDRLTLFGRTIHGTWDICRDGSKWAKDFDITYTRADVETRLLRLRQFAYSDGDGRKTATRKARRAREDALLPALLYTAGLSLR